jgi:protein ImuA
MRETALKLAALRARLERPGEAETAPPVPLGHAPADHCLKGGLRPGTLHEVYAAAPGHEASATGFALALARLMAQRKWLFWVRQDFAALEEGEPYGMGLCEFGIDPSRILIARVPDAASVLRAAGEGLATESLGAVVIEPWGESRLFDLATSRRLVLASARTRVTAILLRAGAVPQPSAAETRWLVRAGKSHPDNEDWADNEDWGTPVFDASLVRNRHGTTGQWVMEWTDDGFREPAHSRRVAAVPADGQAHAARAAAGN